MMTNACSCMTLLRRTVELGHLSVAQDLVKFLLVSRETDRGRGKMLDCYDASFVLGAMVPEGAADSAGRLLFALYRCAAPYSAVLPARALCNSVYAVWAGGRQQLRVASGG